MSIWEGQHKCETLLCSCFFLSLSHHVVLCPLFPLKSLKKKKIQPCYLWAWKNSSQKEKGKIKKSRLTEENLRKGTCETSLYKEYCHANRLHTFHIKTSQTNWVSTLFLKYSHKFHIKHQGHIYRLPFASCCKKLCEINKKCHYISTTNYIFLPIMEFLIAVIGVKSGRELYGHCEFSLKCFHFG